MNQHTYRYTYPKQVKNYAEVCRYFSAVLCRAKNCPFHCSKPYAMGVYRVAIGGLMFRIPILSLSSCLEGI